ncbi:hypothetical protein C8F04DRAFT_1396272 [Mycena alexandri]|uniref:Uncharacterized protein n=1 Tax=Mycena alexandri TaxID=1745969 RepID=A0AAD6SV80_9AGAR|nr:hypothetical protein C8F04DRAFT_1396272 [Mycena alexandri]
MRFSFSIRRVFFFLAPHLALASIAQGDFIFWGLGADVCVLRIPLLGLFHALARRVADRRRLGRLCARLRVSCLCALFVLSRWCRSLEARLRANRIVAYMRLWARICRAFLLADVILAPALPSRVVSSFFPRIPSFRLSVRRSLRPYVRILDAYIVLFSSLADIMLDSERVRSCLGARASSAAMVSFEPLEGGALVVLSAAGGTSLRRRERRICGCDVLLFFLVFYILPTYYTILSFLAIRPLLPLRSWTRPPSFS